MGYHIIPPIPPIPPMPPMPPAGASGLGSSTTIASVVSINEATPDESTRAVLTTLVGSMIPDLVKSQYTPLAASKPLPLFPSSNSLSTTIDPSNPAF